MITVTLIEEHQWLSCADCAMLREYQPCEACVNYGKLRGDDE